MPDFVFFYVLAANDQTDVKPELLQRNAANTSAFKLKTQTQQPVVFNNQVIVLLELFYM